MLFNSFHFAAFIIVVVLAVGLLRERHVGLFLVGASYYFYAGWNPYYLPLLLITTLIDYYACTALLRTEGERRRRGLVLLSLCGNLGLLCYFKYGAFLWANLARPVGSLAGFDLPRSLEIVLPVGISFYTFQSMGQTIDVYRRKFTERVSFPEFALYVSFFPQLVAGPILRGSDFFPQLRRGWKDRERDWYGALNLILIGFLKKILIADNLALYVDKVYGAAGQYSWLEVTVATYAFAAQIYCDFSGYTDIARGVARLLGVEININFNYPYFSQSIVEFWRRWHISLSTWLRDYLYISLGGNRHGRANTYRNLLITMILGGFWHGAAWQFLLWGTYHGILLALGHALPQREARGALDRAARTVVTFHLVLAGWFLFRVEHLSDVGLLLGSAPGAALVQSPADLMSALAVLAGFAAVHAWRHARPVDLLRNGQPLLAQVAVVSLAVAVLVLFGAPSASFLYFQF